MKEMAKFTLILSGMLWVFLLQTHSHAHPMQQNETTPYPTTAVVTITTDAAPPEKEPPDSTDAPPLVLTTLNPLYKTHNPDYTAEKYEVIDVSHGTLGRNAGGSSDIDANKGDINKFITGQTTRIYTTGTIDDDFWLKHLGDDFKNAIHLQVGVSDHYNELTRGFNDTQVHHEFLGGSDLLSLRLPYQTAQAYGNFVQSSIRNTTDETEAINTANRKHYVYHPFERIFGFNSDSGGGFNKAPVNLRPKPHYQRTQTHNYIDEIKSGIVAQSASGYGKEGNNKEQIESKPSDHGTTNMYRPSYGQAAPACAYDISMNLYHEAELAASKSLRGCNGNSAIGAGGDSETPDSSSLLPYILRKPASTYDASKPSQLPFKSHFNDYLNRKQREVQEVHAVERGL